MATQLLTEKYAESLDGVLGCYDRIVITGSLAELCYAKGMTHYLYAHEIRIFDYAQWAEPLRDALRTNAEAVAHAHGLTIEYISKKNFRKEDRIQALLAERGSQPGLVHIFSALEPCASYRPWHDKETGHTYLTADSGKCLHYYFYFIDAELGLCYLRVPTGVPFACSSTATATPASPLNSPASTAPTIWWTMRSAMWPTTPKPTSLRPTGIVNGCAASWMPGRATTVRSLTPYT
jgi:hypothetical protein